MDCHFPSSCIHPGKFQSFVHKENTCMYQIWGPLRASCVCLSPGLYHDTTMTALEWMNGLMEGDGAASSVSHWKSLGNICWGPISLRMAALSTWLPREVSFWGCSQHHLAEPCGHSELWVSLWSDLEREGRELWLNTAWATFSPWFIASHAQSLVTLKRRDSADHSLGGRRGHPGSGRRTPCVARAGSPSLESAGGPWPRTSQLRAEMGLP